MSRDDYGRACRIDLGYRFYEGGATSNYVMSMVYCLGLSSWSRTCGLLYINSVIDLSLVCRCRAKISGLARVL
jgi:hypothetical protein